MTTQTPPMQPSHVVYESFGSVIAGFPATAADAIEYVLSIGYVAADAPPDGNLMGADGAEWRWFRLSTITEDNQ